MADSALDRSQLSSQPPFRCVICGKAGSFLMREHIVPESLGNDIVVLAPGWICDSCNNVCSGFESRALSNSILGIERCRIGVTTKKRKPATARLHGVSWFSEPSARDNVLSAEARWNEIPVLWGPKEISGSLRVPLHDDSNRDVCRLLLKMGIELLAAAKKAMGIQPNTSSAAEVVLGRSAEPWPYFILCDGGPNGSLVSVFESTPDVHEYVRSCGFDLFVHHVDGQEILFFEYGHFFAAVSLTSRNTEWIRLFPTWSVSYVGCPVEFSHLAG
jgi:hypothetical protein